MKIGIFGAGSWGTALSIVLHDKGHEISLWSNDPAEADKIRHTRRLVHKLPEVTVPDTIAVTTHASDFIAEAELLLVAVPSKFMRGFAQNLFSQISGKPKIVVSATKGMEDGTLCTMSEILDEIWQPLLLQGLIHGVAVLSGPSHAEEVARRLPTAVVAAHENRNIACQVQEIFQTPYFRVYTNPDRKGVEIGAALKNVIAIAVGISDGLGFGDNARAALISRGIHELSQAGALMGADPQTFSGLTGLGDLVVTCTSRHSRNRKFGELLAKGYKPAEAEDEIGMVVEGLTTVRALPELKRRHHLELPISEEVYAIAIDGADPKSAVERLMLRELKPERKME